MASPTRAQGDADPVTVADALRARKTWRTVEPLHALVYFAPEAADMARRLGLEPQAGYFASRSAPMGAVTSATVIATFYNFCPRLVASAIDGVWDRIRPEEIVAGRTATADTALRRILRDDVDSPEMARAAELARAVALVASASSQGRPLFAGHAALPWPTEPHLVLWHAQTLLREFRGDGHVAALVTEGIGPVDALVLHVASGEVPEKFLRATRGWSDEEWEAGVARVVADGWAEMDGNGRLVLSGAGAARRQRVEDATDRMAAAPYRALGDEACDELRTLARPFAKVVAAASGLG